MESVDSIQVNESVDHLFRHHSGQMVSVLSRIFGLKHIDLIEDSIQEAMIAALKKWSFQGIPENPRAWLIEVAKNKIFDNLRRNNKFEPVDEEFEKAIKDADAINFADSIGFANEVSEDVLQMMFACCHHAISPDSQVAITLKTVSGFSVREISTAFLSNEESVAKLITRAKQKLRKQNVCLEMPSPTSLNSRLDSVLKVLYLVFNEGYNSFNGEKLIRNDLCFEAIRLGKILANHPLTTLPKTHALLALFFFQAARLNARFDKNGDILVLAEQNRNLWDKAMIAAGLKHFRLSASGIELSDFHLEAEIASAHTLAKDFESTDWQRILNCYETLAKRSPSAVIMLNKAIAMSKVSGANEAITQLKMLKTDLDSYMLFHITLGELQTDAGLTDLAQESFQKALKLAENEIVKSFLHKKLAQMPKQTI